MHPLPYREVARKLRAAGFSVRSQSGSHVKFTRRTARGEHPVMVPRHREITVGTLAKIIRVAGLTPQEFLDL